MDGRILRFCKECGSDAVIPAVVVDFDDPYDVELWPEVETSDDWECECGHVGPVGVDILDPTVPYYKVLRQEGI